MHEAIGILVIGGGIAGIQASLDLADAGITTCLVEKDPSLGGRMAQLDKTFPTNDCSTCILSPKLVAAARHPNIRLFTLSEVIKIGGKAGDFHVVIRKNPRYVDEDKCVGCGLCAEKCPVKVPNDFDLGLSMRKAIYVPFPQAVPLKYSIDSENCLYFRTGKCKLCIKACPSQAINHEQKVEYKELHVKSIIVATGYEQLNPQVKKEYGYGEYKDVLTSLEFERLLSASGPTLGEIRRPSDDKAPKSIVFVQCVGSRDKNLFEHCSRICCMSSIKEAVIAKEHDPSIKITILHNDMRCFGKKFEEYYENAKKDIEFIRGRCSEVLKNKKNLILRVEDIENDELKEINADMVVLASAIVAPKENKKLAKVLHIETDENNFLKEGRIDSVESTKEGIYLCGCVQSPKDIPDGVAQASAAAVKAMKFVPDRIKKENIRLPLEYEETRIGVFVCHCGTNIASVVNVAQVTKYAKKLPNVVHAEDNLFTCSDNAQKHIQEVIESKGLNRIVVAACTPRTHEPIFRETCAKSGLNPYLFEMANIRDHCSWVHMREPKKATEKAKDLVRMAVTKAGMLEPLQPEQVDIEQSALVIGGGIAGIQASLDLAAQGFKTYLIEKNEKLGGRLLELNKLSPSGIDASTVLEEKIEKLKKSDVEVFTAAEITNISGFVGSFDVAFEQKNKEKKVKIGVIIIAMGSDVYKPKEYGYGTFSNVITNIELEKRLKEKAIDAEKIKTVTFIQCVGARDDEHQDCSRYCCETAVHQALLLTSIGINVNILYRDMRTFSKGAEEMYKRCCEEGVKFTRYLEDKKPEFNGKVVKVFDSFANRQIDLPTDLLVLSCGMVSPNDAKTIQDMIKIPLDENHFFLEKHPKLGPVETNTTGIYVCGCCQSPKNVVDTLIQASAAAAKASITLSFKNMQAEATIGVVDEDKCRGCGRCEEVCEYNAVKLEEKDGLRIAVINAALCKGCGTCAVICPTNAIEAKGFTIEQITAMVEAALEVVYG